MYKLHPCTKEAQKLVDKYIVKVKKSKLPLRTGVETPFPFKAMSIGQSFFMDKKDLSYYIDYLVKKRIRDYNKRYCTEFAIVKHEDKLEVVRVG